METLLRKHGSPDFFQSDRRPLQFGSSRDKKYTRSKMSDSEDPAIINITTHARCYLFKSDMLKCRILNVVCFCDLNDMLADFHYRGCFIESGAPVLQWQQDMYHKC